MSFFFAINGNRCKLLLFLLCTGTLLPFNARTGHIGCCISQQELRRQFMWYCINAVVDLVALYPSGALAVVFLAAIVEAVAVLGILIPGTPILMAVAGAAAMAGQPMLPFLTLAIAGAVIGDFLSFWFGKRFSVRLRGVWPFSRRPALMDNAARFFDRYGTYSVALCRFVPVLRSTVPLVAGMAGMRQRRFVTGKCCIGFRLGAGTHLSGAVGRPVARSAERGGLAISNDMGCGPAGWLRRRVGGTPRRHCPLSIKVIPAAKPAL